MELFHARVPSLSFFKTNVRIFGISVSDNTPITLLLFFSEDGPAYGRKMMTGYLRQKHKVVIAEKRVDSALLMASPQFRAQRRTSTTRAVNLIPYREIFLAISCVLTRMKTESLLSRFYVKVFNL